MKNDESSTKQFPLRGSLARFFRLTNYVRLSVHCKRQAIMSGLACTAFAKRVHFYFFDYYLIVWTWING